MSLSLLCGQTVSPRWELHLNDNMDAQWRALPGRAILFRIKRGDDVGGTGAH